MKAKYILMLATLIPFKLFSQLQMTNFGNLSLHSGALITLYGDFKNNGNFQDTGQVFTFKGTSNQSITGTVIPDFNNCNIDNNSGVSLLQPVRVKNTLNLLNGQLILNSNTLTILNGAQTAVVRTNGNIVSEQTNNSGKVAWLINTISGPHIFPFATNTGQYIPFTLDLTAGNIGMVSLATYPTSFVNLPYPASPDLVTHVNNSLGVDNSANTVDRFWQIEKDGPSGTAAITFTATSAEVGSISNLFAYRWNSVLQGWETPPGVQTNSPYSVTVQSVTTFSPWTLAGNDMPLPIELLSFKASLNSSRGVDLNWVTSSEINNDFFSVEKTLDGINYELVGIVDGAGNSNQIINYKLIDNVPYDGTSYYRLKQTDFDMNVRNSQLESIYIGNNSDFEVSVFPNPNNGYFNMAISGIQNETVQLSIVDITGKVYYSENMTVESNYFVHPMNKILDLVPGMYTLRLYSNLRNYSTKLIIQ